MTDRIDWEKAARGLMSVILGLAVMLVLSGCMASKAKEIPAEGERIVYNSDCFKVIQGSAVHKQYGSSEREYIFLPLTIKNTSDSNIIFSSSVCIKAHALPSGEICSASNRSAIAVAREYLKDFALFDGMIYGNGDTAGWLIFDAPFGTEQLCIEFYTGIGSDEHITFNCKV